MARGDLPEAIRALLDDLERQGYTVLVERHTPEHFGNWLIELANGAHEVRITKDRGQWLVDIRLCFAWLSPDALLVALDGHERDVDPLTAEQAARDTREVLRRAPRGLVGRWRLRLAAGRVQARRARQLLR